MEKNPAHPAEGAPEKTWPAILLILLLPVLLLLVDRTWLASPLFLDPYIYLGYYLNLPGHLQAFPDHYVTTRLPVLIPGWLAHSVLPPIAASVALRLALLYVSLFALSVLVRLHEGGRAALLVVALLVGSPFFLGAIGTDYTDAYAIAFLLFALAGFQIAARRERPAPWLLTSGAALSMLVFTNPVFALFGGLTLLFFLGVNAEGQRHGWIRSAAWLAVGFLLATAALALCNVLLGGPALFFLPSATASVHLARHHGAFHHRPWAWLLSASWLVFPATVALGGALLLVIQRTRPGRALPVAMLGLGLAALLIMERIHLGIVRFWYYATPLLPFAAIALGWLLGPFCRALSARAFVGVLALAVALSLGVNACPGQFAGWSMHGPWRVALPLAIGVGAFLLLVGRPGRGGRLVGFLLLLAVSQGWTRLGFRYEAPWPEVPISIYDRIREHDPERTDVLCAVVETVRAVQTIDRRAETPFWFDYEEPIGLVYREIACTHFLRCVNESFPATAGPLLHGSPGQRPPRHIAILSQRPDAEAVAGQALTAFGYPSRPCLLRTIQQGRIRFQLLIFRHDRSAASR